MTRKEAIAELKRDIELENDFTEDYINAVNMAIEALEQEPCEDAVSRQAVIDEIEFFQINPQHFDFVSLIDNIKDLPSVNPQKSGWIPVSERLPEDSGEYFVTVIDEDDETYRHTGISWYAHPKDYDIEEGDWRELMIDEKVIAWMPLPEPYKESEVQNAK